MIPSCKPTQAPTNSVIIKINEYELENMKLQKENKRLENRLNITHRLLRSKERMESDDKYFFEITFLFLLVVMIYIYIPV